jgi:hypothetical protein
MPMRTPRAAGAGAAADTAAATVCDQVSVIKSAYWQS